MKRLAILLLLACSAFADDADVIRQHILNGAEAFMKGDPEGVMKHYGRDIVLSYPGIPDMRYDELVKAFGAIRNRKLGSVVTKPELEEILVDGNMAAVRITWNTTGDGPPRQMRDLQVWRKGSDGEWRFVRGMHYKQPQ